MTTLAVDVGGTGIKASVLGPTGRLEHDPVRVRTPYPLSPDVLISVIESLAGALPSFDRVSVGFPGLVREGKVRTAPHFVSPSGPGGQPAPKLEQAWTGYDLSAGVATALGKPTRAANDADLQGAAVVTGHGLELVVTLGTGIGTGLFYHGRVCPHLELAHHPLRHDETYNDHLGNAARQRIGAKKWNRRVALMLETVRDLLFFDHLFLGGGNAKRLTLELDPDVSIVDNAAGILGGIKLWERAGFEVEPQVPARRSVRTRTPASPPSTAPAAGA
jgi:polyphosphate glucokinase